jgi:hypothetical protein
MFVTPELRQPVRRQKPVDPASAAASASPMMDLRCTRIKGGRSSSCSSSCAAPRMPSEWILDLVREACVSSPDWTAVVPEASSSPDADLEFAGPCGRNSRCIVASRGFHRRLRCRKEWMLELPSDAKGRAPCSVSEGAASRAPCRLLEKAPALRRKYRACGLSPPADAWRARYRVSGA